MLYKKLYLWFNPLLIKLVSKLQILYWNIASILLGLVLMISVHIYILQLTDFCVLEGSLYTAVNNEKDSQRNNATLTSKPDGTIVQEYSLNSTAQIQEDVGKANILLIIFMLLMLPFFIAMVYIFYIKLTGLAVNKDLCVGFIFLTAGVLVCYMEISKFIEDGNGESLLYSCPAFLLITGILSLFVSMESNQKTSPYYKSLTV